jgi:hypothetical protein
MHRCRAGFLPALLRDLSTLSASNLLRALPATHLRGSDNVGGGIAIVSERGLPLVGFSFVVGGGADRA